MNAQDLIPVLLLTLLSLAVVAGAASILCVMHWRRKHASSHSPTLFNHESVVELDAPAFSQRPTAWVAVRSRNLAAVQSALGLSNPRPCTCVQGLTGDQTLFITPPIQGWILITGSRLPDPADDVDACFRFLVDLSRKLGHVQFFSASSALNHHAWVRAESGRVIRAYAWAGRTLWNQGVRTQAEIDLGLRCLHYFENPGSGLFHSSDFLVVNTERVPLLAAAWSIDPATIDEHTLEETSGITGEPPRLY